MGKGLPRVSRCRRSCAAGTLLWARDRTYTEARCPIPSSTGEAHESSTPDEARNRQDRLRALTSQSAEHALERAARADERPAACGLGCAIARGGLDAVARRGLEPSAPSGDDLECAAPAGCGISATAPVAGRGPTAAPLCAHRGQRLSCSAPRCCLVQSSHTSTGRPPTPRAPRRPDPAATPDPVARKASPSVTAAARALVARAVSLVVAARVRAAQRAPPQAPRRT